MDCLVDGIFDGGSSSIGRVLFADVELLSDFDSCVVDDGIRFGDAGYLYGWYLHHELK